MGIATSFAGIAFGAALNHYISKGAVASEREYAENREAKRRQMDAAAKFDEGVMEALDGALIWTGDRREVADRLDAARGHLMRAWQRSIVLADPEIEQRVNALDMSMVVASNHGRGRRPDGDETMNIWPISVAMRELRVALACFQRGETPPSAEYPRSGDVVKLAHPDGRSVGLEGVNEFLTERGVLG